MTNSSQPASISRFLARIIRLMYWRLGLHQLFCRCKGDGRDERANGRAIPGCATRTYPAIHQGGCRAEQGGSPPLFYICDACKRLKIIQQHQDTLDIAQNIIGITHDIRIMGFITCCFTKHFAAIQFRGTGSIGTKNRLKQKQPYFFGVCTTDYCGNDCSHSNPPLLCRYFAVHRR